MAYKVQEVARLCGVSASAIYKIIKAELDELTTIPLEGQETFGTVDNHSKASGRVDNHSTRYFWTENRSTYITDEGLEYFKERFSSSGNRLINDEYVSSLVKQLEEKDKQLSEKDRQLLERDNQINQLLEQSRNYQVLLKTEQDKQVLLLQQPKRIGWVQRLFGRKEIDG